MFFDGLKQFFQPQLTQQKQTGNWAESLAADELKKKGYRIAARNWMRGADELDIVAMEGAQVVFVEVRARKSNARVPGALTLNGHKKTALRRAANAYLHTLPEEVGWRFDVVEVSYSSKKDYELYHYEGVSL